MEHIHVSKHINQQEQGGAGAKEAGELDRSGLLVSPGDDSWDREHDQPPQPYDLWTRTNLGENLPYPLTPLTATNFPALFALNNAASTGPQLTRRLYGRLYFNEGAFFHSFVEEMGLPASLLHKMWGSRQRRLAYNFWYTVAAPDALGPDGLPMREEAQQRNILKGIAASGGYVRGRARVVQTIQEALEARPVQSGDILVTTATDPGWTPIFPLVSGLVLEIGGQLSHGAIVAREYGLPAVMNVRGATRLIADGQIIEVDGSKGLVTLV